MVTIIQRLLAWSGQNCSIKNSVPFSWKKKLALTLWVSYYIYDLVFSILLFFAFSFLLFHFLCTNTHIMLFMRQTFIHYSQKPIVRKVGTSKGICFSGFCHHVFNHSHIFHVCSYFSFCPIDFRYPFSMVENTSSCRTQCSLKKRFSTSFFIQPIHRICCKIVALFCETIWH